MADNITIKDIARICGVGVGTVSRAINNDPRVSDATREKILKAVKDYHYVPNNSARNLKMVESNTIGLLFSGIDNPFFQGMISVFERACDELGYSFFLYAVKEHDWVENVAMEACKERRLKGLIILGGQLSFPNRRLDSLGVPYVLCTVTVPKTGEQLPCSSVSIDDEKESFRAVSYLIGLGHRRIAILAGRTGEYPHGVGALRLTGYRRALEKNGIAFDPGLVFYMSEEIPEYSMPNGYDTMKRLLDSGADFTAVFAVSDTMAFGACRALWEAGRRIPEDCSIIGYDGQYYTEFMTPSLTTVVQPVTKMALKTVKLLDDAIRKKTAPVCVTYDAELCIRESVRRLE